MLSRGPLPQGWPALIRGTNGSCGLITRLALRLLEWRQVRVCVRPDPSLRPVAPLGRERLVKSLEWSIREQEPQLPERLLSQDRRSNPVVGENETALYCDLTVFPASIPGARAVGRRIEMVSCSSDSKESKDGVEQPIHGLVKEVVAFGSSATLLSSRLDRNIISGERHTPQTAVQGSAWQFGNSLRSIGRVAHIALKAVITGNFSCPVKFQSGKSM